MADKLTLLWTEICMGFNIEAIVREKWLQVIKSSYERSYYDFNYLINKLTNFEACRAKLKQQEAVFVALIFQSIDYSSKSSINLEICIEKLNDFVTEGGLLEKDIDMVNKIRELIELSVTNSSDEFWEEGNFGSGDTHYFLDINFAHLAQDWEEYREFSVKTRNEYEFLSDASYKVLRRKVLQSFLQIPNIYATSEFRSQFEAKARENIQREIDELD